MTIFLLVFLVCIKMILLVDSSPKLLRFKRLRTRNNIFESSRNREDLSSDSYLIDDSLVPILRNDSPHIRTNFEGYIFDPSKCKYVNKRLLCGYDRNKGEITENVIVDLGNGCRIRDDRMECGYNIKNEMEIMPQSKVKHKRKPHTKTKRPQRVRSRIPLNNEILKSIGIKSDVLPKSWVTTLFKSTLSTETTKGTNTTKPMKNSKVKIMDIQANRQTLSTNVFFKPSKTIETDNPHQNSNSVHKTDTPKDTTQKAMKTNLNVRQNDETQEPLTIFASPPSLVSTKATLSLTTTTSSLATDDWTSATTASVPTTDTLVSTINDSVSSTDISTSTTTTSFSTTSASVSTTASLASTSKLTTIITTTAVTTPVRITETMETTTTKEFEENDESKMNAICVDQNDRIVCYDYKQIVKP